MEQLTLLPVETKPVEYVKDGMLHRRHHWGVERNFGGIRQTKLKGEKRWQFYICGFTGPRLPDGSDGIGHVLCFDGGEVPCEMDMKGRVKINGRWYTYSSWDH